MPTYELRRISSQEITTNLSVEDIQEMVHQGAIDADDEIREAGKGKWHKAVSVNGLNFKQETENIDLYGEKGDHEDGSGSPKKLFSSLGDKLKLGNLKQHVSSATDKITTTSTTVSDVFKKKMSDYLPVMLEKLSELQPVLQECGFIIGDIKLVAGISPGIGLTVEQEKNGVIRINKVMKEQKLTKFQKTILDSINRIYSLNETAEKYNFTIGQIDIMLTIPPKVTAHLNSTKSRAFH